MSKRVENVGRWLLFSVIIALLPILFGILGLKIFNQPITVQNTIASGQLLLVSTAVLAEAIGELLVNDKVNRIFKIYVTGINLAVFGMACLLYSTIVSATNNVSAGGKTIDSNTVAIISFIVFGWTMLTGIGSKWVAEI